MRKMVVFNVADPVMLGGEGKLLNCKALGSMTVESPPASPRCQEVGALVLPRRVTKLRPEWTQ